MKGKLIVLTGIDGSGKTVQTKLLYDKLLSKGIPAETIDFPQYGRTLFADMIAKYLRGEFGSLKDVSPYLAAVLFAGDRFEAKSILEGWLNEGKVVIANRYVCDNIAHQGVRVYDSDKHANLPKFVDWLTRLEYDVYGLPKSDLNVFLSIPHTVAYDLIVAKAERAYLGNSKRDIHEADFNYLENTSIVFHTLAMSQPNWETVDCMNKNGKLLSELEISKKVWNCIKRDVECNPKYTV
ncbi:MAG: thymidylate kinase [Bacteroidia bacterium]|nr:thymidylate kinase [Bacteroidia bacterium]